MGERWTDHDERRVRHAEDAWYCGDRAALEELPPVLRAACRYRLGFGTSGDLEALTADQRAVLFEAVAR